MTGTCCNRYGESSERNGEAGCNRRSKAAGAGAGSESSARGCATIQALMLRGRPSRASCGNIRDART